ncbi:MAG TPA: VOC family protein [Solirubrobacterales bacterium]|jgi:catechol 2,3-dioxygenase-like lactoylglutathione lyase family enzyme
MLSDSKAFSGFAVDDLDAARRFYGETLEQRVEVLDEANGLMTLHLAGDRPTLIYRSPDFTPASYTILNFPVDDVDAAVDWLTGRGVTFERYEGMPQEANGVMKGNGPDIAWFKDPAGNTLSVLKED